MSNLTRLFQKWLWSWNDLVPFQTVENFSLVLIAGACCCRKCKTNRHSTANCQQSHKGMLLMWLFAFSEPSQQIYMFWRSKTFSEWSLKKLFQKSEIPPSPPGVNICPKNLKLSIPPIWGVLKLFWKSQANGFLFTLPAATSLDTNCFSFCSYLKGSSVKNLLLPKTSCFQ